MQDLFSKLKTVQTNYLEQGLTPAVTSHFHEIVLEYYNLHARQFPWRDNPTPYAVMVSEIMLQQTQADRVVPKFEKFLQAFPTLEILAETSTSELLAHWQGLGYNRRALNLRRAASIIADHCAGNIPRTAKELLALPGIGLYTSGAIQAFAFNLPALVIDTNIRRVYLEIFFPDKQKVSDKELEPIIQATLYQESPRHWYSALMDIGSLLPKIGTNANTRSKHFTKQGALVGSNREVRGKLISALVQTKKIAINSLPDHLAISPDRIHLALSQLLAEGFVREHDGVIYLAE